MFVLAATEPGDRLQFTERFCLALNRTSLLHLWSVGFIALLGGAHCFYGTLVQLTIRAIEARSEFRLDRHENLLGVFSVPSTLEPGEYHQRIGASQT